MRSIKKCNKCLKELHVSKFHKASKGDGYQYTCKDCKRELGKITQRNRALKLPEYNRKAALKRRYDLTIEEYDKMLEYQGFVCDICKTGNPGNEYKHFCVDHNHKTGKVRGLLCGQCNRALGGFYDSLKNLKNAVKYLEKHEEN